MACLGHNNFPWATAEIRRCSYSDPVFVFTDLFSFFPFNFYCGAGQIDVRYSYQVGFELFEWFHVFYS
jgi:hypothetical protein